MKLTKQKRALLCRRLRCGERPVDLAREFGLSRSCVSRIMHAAGIPPRSAKTEIIAAYRSNPDLNTRQVAALVGCSPATVRKIASECRLDIPVAPMTPRSTLGKRARDLYALGRAARAAGLTVATINSIAAQRMHPHKPGTILHITTGLGDERLCQRYAAGHVRPPAYFLRALLRSDHGWQWLAAAMEGSDVEWWRDLQRARFVGEQVLEITKKE